jgi:hypothetical protein
MEKKNLITLASVPRMDTLGLFMINEEKVPANFHD